MHIVHKGWGFGIIMAQVVCTLHVDMWTTCTYMEGKNIGWRALEREGVCTITTAAYH